MEQATHAINLRIFKIVVQSASGTGPALRVLQSLQDSRITENHASDGGRVEYRRPDHLRIKLVCGLLFIGACVLLYVGTTMLFLVPGNPGENYIKSLFAGRFVYGVLPFTGSVLLLTTVGWLWDLSNGSLDIAKAIGRTFSTAVAAILLFWVVVIVIAGLRHTQP